MRSRMSPPDLYLTVVSFPEDTRDLCEQEEVLTKPGVDMGEGLVLPSKSEQPVLSS